MDWLRPNDMRGPRRVVVIGALLASMACSRVGYDVFPGGDALSPGDTRSFCDETLGDSTPGGDDYVPTISFGGTSLTVEEPGGPIAVQVGISEAMSQDVAVSYTVAGTASSPEDYGALSGLVTILATQLSATISINLVDDITPEAPETLILSLSSATGANIGSPSTFTARIEDMDGWPTIGLAQGHTCGIDEGALSCWGDNLQGKYNGGSGVYYRSTPVAPTSWQSGVRTVSVNDTNTCVLIADAIWCSTEAGTEQLIASGAHGLSGKYSHHCAAVDGDAYCWGENNSSELGDGTTVDSATPVPVQGLPGTVDLISAGHDHTCALVNDAVYCWGEGVSGQLGSGVANASATPVLVQGLPSGVTMVTAGWFHSCAIAQGALYCWGSNGWGEQGYSTVNVLSAQSVPGHETNAQDVAAGRLFTCALTGDEVSCWGANFGGQLGDGTFSGSFVQRVVTGLPGAGSLAHIGTGYYHSCVAVNNPTSPFYCWGFSRAGQTGDGLPTGRPTLFATNMFNVTLLAATTGTTGAHTCLLRAGELRCQGRNDFNQLGSNVSYFHRSNAGAVDSLPAGTISDLSVGHEHSCAVIDDSAVCWGTGNRGQVGTGGGGQTRLPPTAVVGLGTGAGVSAVTAGPHHTCAVVGGGVQCWGENSQSQVGNDTIVFATTTPVAVSPALSGIQLIAAGHEHTCASDGTDVWCWGNNASGQAGSDSVTPELAGPTLVADLTTAGSIEHLAAGQDFTCTQMNNPTVRSIVGAPTPRVSSGE